MKLYFAAKEDRPNVMIRIIVAVLPKVTGGVVTGSQFDPFQIPNSGLCGNRMLLMADKDKGVKFLYDRVIKFAQDPGVFPSVGGGDWQRREKTKLVRIWIKRKKQRAIVWDQTGVDIVNKPLAVYCIPYEQYSTLETDNIASVAGVMRLYYKDP